MISDELLDILDELQADSGELEDNLPGLLVELQNVVDKEFLGLIADYPEVFSQLLKYQEAHLQQLDQHAALLNKIHKHYYAFESDLYIDVSESLSSDDTEDFASMTSTATELTPRTFLERPTKDYLNEVFRMAINDASNLFPAFTEDQPERQEITEIMAELGKWRTSLETNEDYLDMDELSRSIEPLRNSSRIPEMRMLLDRMMQRADAANADEQVLLLKTQLVDKIISSDFNEFTINNREAVAEFHNQVMDADTIEDINAASKSFSKAAKVNAFKQKVENLKIWKSKPKTSTAKQRNLAEEAQTIINVAVGSKKVPRR